MLFEELESEALEAFNVYMDPLVVIYLSIAVVVFSLFSYNKPDLRVFIIPMIALWFSIFFMAVEVHDAEAICLTISGVSSTFSILYYWRKVNNNIQ